MKQMTFISIFLFCTVLTTHAATISPASFCLEKFDIGMNMDLGIDFVMSDVTNKGPIDLNVRKPLQSKILKGYLAIPEANWFYFLNPQIVPGKDGSAKARMFLKVPNKEKYLNQHWVVHVTAKPPKVGMFAMELVGIYMIETRSSDTIKGRPYGPIGVVPSRIHLTKVVPQKNKTARFVIYNNDTKSHTYKISAKTYDQSFYNRLQISQAPGFEWIKDESWVKIEKKAVTVDAGQKKETHLLVNIPKGVEYNNEGWEAIIMVESTQNGGPSGFTRLLISN